jgi:hypothetical protein
MTSPQSEDSLTLTPKATIRQDPLLIPSNSHLHDVSLRSFLMLSSKSFSVFQLDAFQEVSHQNYVLIFCFSIPAHRKLLDFTIRTILSGPYKLLSSSLCNVLNVSLTPCMLCSHTFLVTLLSSTCNLCFSLTARDHISHP